jgi:hypothetical protein
MLNSTLPIAIPLSAAAYLFVIHLLLLFARRSTRFSRPRN